MKYFAVVIMVVVVMLSGCTAGSISMVELPKPEDKTGLPSPLPDYVPVFRPSSDNPANPLRVLDEKVGQTDLVREITGTLYTSSNPSRIYEWYKDEFAAKGWATNYDLPYSEKFQTGKLTCIKGDLVLTVTINYDPVQSRTEILYLGNKFTKPQDGK